MGILYLQQHMQKAERGITSKAITCGSKQTQSNLVLLHMDIKNLEDRFFPLKLARSRTQVVLCSLLFWKALAAASLKEMSSSPDCQNVGSLLVLTRLVDREANLCLEI